MSSKNFSLVILGKESTSTRILFNSLKNEFMISSVILESPVSKMKFIFGRIRKLGIIKAIGQILFQIIIIPVLKIISKKRIAEIKSGFGFLDNNIDGKLVQRVPSANDESTINLLKEINPAVVIISGTRILSKTVLESVPAKFINIHAGITPSYRGVHGAYWALVNNDKENCGVTVHIADSGIDTGKILKQKKITITEKDNFFTYPFLQLGEGIKLLKHSLDEIKAGNLYFEDSKNIKSNLWFHPTIWEYLFYRAAKDIR